MNDVAHELARRAKPAYLKTRAKEAVKGKATEMKERTLGSPWALGVIGGLCTAGIARFVLKRRRARGELPGATFGEVTAEEHVALGEAGEPWEEAGGGNGKRKLGAARERISAARDRMKESVRHQLDRLPDRQVVREKAAAARERARDFAEEEPLIVALGAIALGAALGFLLPVLRKERELLSPYREQAAEKAEAFMANVRERVAGKPGEGEQGPTTTNVPPTEPFPPRS